MRGSSAYPERTRAQKKGLALMVEDVFEGNWDEFKKFGPRQRVGTLIEETLSGSGEICKWYIERVSYNRPNKMWTAYTQVTYLDHYNHRQEQEVFQFTHAELENADTREIY